MDYAVIDGRQRIETILKFVDGDFPLDEKFIFLKDPKIKAGGFYYKDIVKHYPKLKVNFESFELPITCVETDDLDLIDDMFLRLNEAVPLNAAEKRNAISGPLVKSIKRVSVHPFFTNNVKFSNRRYQHFEVSIRLLFIEHFQKTEKKIYDTKKVFLDALVEKYKANASLKTKDIEENVVLLLTKIGSLFAKKDPLLKTQSIIPIYYLVFREIFINKKLHLVTRKDFIDFREEVRKNKALAEKDIKLANYDLIEFDRMSLQGTNDAGSIKERLRIMLEYLRRKKV